MQTRYAYLGVGLGDVLYQLLMLVDRVFQMRHFVRHLELLAQLFPVGHLSQVLLKKKNKTYNLNKRKRNIVNQNHNNIQEKHEKKQKKS